MACSTAHVLAPTLSQQGAAENLPQHSNARGLQGGTTAIGWLQLSLKFLHSTCPANHVLF
jgi:hypothetical protein